MYGQRGDLGFLTSNRGSAPNRAFFGSPGHPSKKGITQVSQTSRMNTDQQHTEVLQPEVASKEMISKRTEWLESQERKLTATLNENRSSTNRLNDMVSELQTQVTRSEEHEKSMHAAMNKLFTEIQILYGYTRLPLHGILCNSDEDSLACFDTLESKTMEHVAKENEWVMLMYPMKNVKTEAGTQTFMRCKTVDPQTGQISVAWVVVFQCIDDENTRFIQKFSLVPT